MNVFNKKTIVRINIVDEREEIPINIYKKGSWKRKPRLFRKGIKWEENVFELKGYFSLHRESTLYRMEGIKYKNNKLIYLSRIHIHFVDQHVETIYFESHKNRDSFLKSLNLIDYIEIKQC